MVCGNGFLYKCLEPGDLGLQYNMVAKHWVIFRVVVTVSDNHFGLRPPGVLVTFQCRHVFDGIPFTKVCQVIHNVRFSIGHFSYLNTFVGVSGVKDSRVGWFYHIYCIIL